MQFPPSLPRRDRCTAIRVGFAAVVLLFLASATAGYLDTTGGVSTSKIRNQAALSQDEREPLVDVRSNAAVVTTSPRETTPGSIVAFSGNGTLAYYNDTHGKYFDVDSAPTGDMSVEYVAGTELGTKRCPGSGLDPCTHIVVERVNLSTGDVTRLHKRHVPGSAIWHDVDRIGEHRFLVGDIATDSVFVLNVMSGLTTWRWDARTDYPIRQGEDADDWTHLNDVEVLESGQFMVSLRNLDQVVFLDCERGLVRNKTLGEDGNHSILYEQHNPDLIPGDGNGPAVLVSDSENNRLVEYQRVDGSWRRTWQ